MRRRLLPLIVLAALVAAGCSGDDSDDGAAPSGGKSASASSAGAFPVSVEHKHGTTEIDEMPERIVTVGFSDQDFVLAFGVAPVAVTDWYGDYEFATWEWAQDELGGAEPVVLNQGAFTGAASYNYEEIATLEPDLIIGLYIDMDAEQYELLSEIAPTVAPSGDYPDYGMPWQEATRVVGQALGQPERAEELVTEVETGFSEASAAHPEFQGVEVAVVESFEAGKVFVRSATDPRTTFMTSLGMVLPEDLAAIAGQKDGGDISDEQLEILDRDLIVWNVGFEPELRGEIEAKPLYAGLDVVQAGHSMFIEDHLISGALTWGTVLSLPYALEHLVPQLADTLGS